MLAPARGAGRLLARDRVRLRRPTADLDADSTPAGEECFRHRRRREVSEIGAGLLLLVGVASGDGEAEADWLARKISGLRIFNDREGKMNLSVQDAGGEVLAVSQFTLLADTRKGKRPSFVGAAPPEEAERLFDYFCERPARPAPVR